jgi:hypothetical protein
MLFALAGALLARVDPTSVVRAYPPSTAVSRRVDHVADSVYAAALEDFRLNSENRELQAEAAALKANLAALNGQNFSLVKQAPPQLRPAFLSAANRAADKAAREIAANVSSMVLTELDAAAQFAANRVLSQACDTAVQSAVLASHKVTMQTIGEEYAGPVSERVRQAVLAECMAESKVMTQKAVQRAALKAREALPQIAENVSLSVTTPWAMEMAASAQTSYLDYQASMNETLAAAAAAGVNLTNITNETNLTALNISLPEPPELDTNISVNVTPPPPPAVPTLPPNATANATEDATENATANATVSDGGLELAPAGPVEPVNVSIGNVTVEADLPPPLPTEPPVPPRVEAAIANAVAHAQEHTKVRVAEMIPDLKNDWVSHFASEMQQLSLTSTA